MDSEIHQLATQLSPYPVEVVTELNKGGNSRIYKVHTAKGEFALKRYPKPQPHDPRDRLQVETQALRCMWDYGIRTIPEVVATNRVRACSLLSWVEGDAISMMSDADITSFTEFLAALAKMSVTAPAQPLPPASEACVSAAAIMTQIEQRLHKLTQAAEEHSMLAHFLSAVMGPYLANAKQRAQRFYEAHDLAFDADLRRAQQVLIPSDFGGHNALRTAQGLVFLDFEYFGWDDPVTSTANFILHPAMALSSGQKHKFCEQMERVYMARDPLYAERLDALLPLYAARWCSIILGEFIPERFAHRVQSGQYRLDEKQSVLTRQMEKATALVSAVAA